MPWCSSVRKTRGPAVIIWWGSQNHMRFWRSGSRAENDSGFGTCRISAVSGQVHRNTYVNGPALLTTSLQLRAAPNIFFAGQISGVEGYVESIATGLVAGRAAAGLSNGQAFPRETAVGSLCAYVAGADPANYQPANITFDLLPKLDQPPRDRKQRHAEVCARELWRRSLSICAPMSDAVSALAHAVERYLAELGRQNASRHYTRCWNYSDRLSLSFVEYFSPVAG